MTMEFVPDDQDAPFVTITLTRKEARTLKALTGALGGPEPDGRLYVSNSMGSIAAVGATNVRALTTSIYEALTAAL